MIVLKHGVPTMHAIARDPFFPVIQVERYLLCPVSRQRDNILLSERVCCMRQAGSMARAGGAASNTLGPQTTGSTPTSASEDTRMVGSDGKGTSMPLRLASKSGSLDQVSIL